jgi:hypothetical protein
MFTAHSFTLSHSWAAYKFRVFLLYSGITAFESVEQACIRFCEEIGKIVAETNNLMQIAFRNGTVCQKLIFKWFHHFSD